MKPVNNEGSLACHTYCDPGDSFTTALPGTFPNLKQKKYMTNITEIQKYKRSSGKIR